MLSIYPGARLGRNQYMAGGTEAETETGSAYGIDNKVHNSGNYSGRSPEKADRISRLER